ncbi:MAG: M23 family metallopeptidase [Candidatus Moranbacteria bacterium]|nr:M23 family metallopeptidase [Candidatus Moranbacteria bacterium]
MKKIIIILAIVILAGTVFLLAKNVFRKTVPPAPANSISMSTPASENNNPPQEMPVPSAPTDNQNTPTVQNSNGFQSPLDRAAERVTKKPFGIYITPKTSPVQPERFQGYHTGTDFEIFPEEQSADVSVRAVCSGKIAVKRSASGYGGMLVQNCTLDNQSITVIYGHLKLASITKNAGDTLNTGDEIGILGKAYSTETDGERKHLHLGVSKGFSISILGYVQSQSELSGWIDPCSLGVCK